MKFSLVLRPVLKGLTPNQFSSCTPKMFWISKASTNEGKARPKKARPVRR